MASQQMLRSSSIFSYLCYRQLAARFGSTLSKQSSSHPSVSKGHDDETKYRSEYPAADMYDHTTFTYYEIEAAMTKFRLPQPSAFDPLKPEASPPKK